MARPKRRMWMPFRVGRRVVEVIKDLLFPGIDFRRVHFVISRCCSFTKNPAFFNRLLISLAINTDR